MDLGVANEGGDVVWMKESIGEDFRLWKTRRWWCMSISSGLFTVGMAYGSSAIDAAHREICSR
jgi:hypothetical protein